MEGNLIIRDIRKNEIYLLKAFLYDAIFVSEGIEKPAKEIIEQPELSLYIDAFGKDTDVCLVADLNGKLIGAIWARLFTEAEKGFGFVDAQTPELSMSVNENYRNQGIGTDLMKNIINRLKQLHYEQVSLSVDKLNYAFGMYQRLGFSVVKSDEKSATMVRKLK